jgi:DNA-binding PadR family transcriptional regulator
MHGYGIVQRIHEAAEDLLKVEDGSLYPALYRMEERGWIKSEWGVSENNRRAKFYKLTSKENESSKPNAPTGTASLKQSRRSCRPPKMRIPLRSNRKKTAFEVEEELRFHIEMLERKYAQQGMSHAQAKAAAWKRFGNLERVKKQCVHISLRNSLLRRVLKTASILIALTGLAIHAISSDFRVARIGTVLIIIAISGRLLLHVRIPKDAART